MYGGVLGYVPIRTPSGERPVRELKAGDIVCGGSGKEVPIFDIKVVHLTPRPGVNPYILMPGYAGATTGVAICPGTRIKLAEDKPFCEVNELTDVSAATDLPYTLSYFSPRFEDETESYFAGGIQVLGGPHRHKICLPYDEFLKLVEMQYGGPPSEEVMEKIMRTVHRTEDNDVIFIINKKVTEPMPPTKYQQRKYDEHEGTTNDEHAKDEHEDAANDEHKDNASNEDKDANISDE